MPGQLGLPVHRRLQHLLYSVGAAVIGGTTLFGGKGKVINAVIGGMVIAVIDNGMGLMGSRRSAVHVHRPDPAGRRQRRRPDQARAAATGTR